MLPTGRVSRSGRIINVPSKLRDTTAINGLSVTSQQQAPISTCNSEQEDEHNNTSGDNGNNTSPTQSFHQSGIPELISESLDITSQERQTLESTDDVYTLTPMFPPSRLSRPRNIPDYEPIPLINNPKQITDPLCNLQRSTSINLNSQTPSHSNTVTPSSFHPQVTATVTSNTQTSSQINRRDFQLQSIPPNPPIVFPINNRQFQHQRTLSTPIDFQLNHQDFQPPNTTNGTNRHHYPSNQYFTSNTHPRSHNLISRNEPGEQLNANHNSLSFQQIAYLFEQFEQRQNNRFETLRHEMERVVQPQNNPNFHPYNRPDGFPLDSLVHFDAFEVNAESQIALENYLVFVGGVDLNAATNQFLSEAMTPELCTNFIWTNRAVPGFPNLRSLYNTSIGGVFFRAASRCQNFRINNRGEFGNSMMKAIQNAKQRYRDARRRRRGNANLGARRLYDLEMERRYGRGDNDRDNVDNNNEHI